MDASGRPHIPGQHFHGQHYIEQHYPGHQSYTWPKRYQKPQPFPPSLPPNYPFSYTHYPPPHVLASYPSFPNYAPASYDVPNAYTPLGRYPGYHSIPRIDHSSGAYIEPLRSVPVRSPFGEGKAILTGDFHRHAVEEISKPKPSKICNKHCGLSKRPSLIRARRIKQQKEVCQRVLVILLTELSLCIVFACAFRFGMTEELSDINDKYPWFKWLSLAFYGACCLVVGLAPTAIQQHKYIGYLILAALTYSFCFGVGWIATFHYWEAIFTLVCFAVTTIIIILLTYVLDFEEVISLVGFSLTQAILLIFFGFLTLLLRYAYYVEIHTLLIVYLITLFFPMYVIFDIWMIVNGWRYAKPPTDNVLSAIITLLTDLTMYPCLLATYLTKKRCFLVYVRHDSLAEDEAADL